MIYLDHNATTPPLPEAVQAVAEGMRLNWANPSSQHAAGQDAKRALVGARATVARFLGAKPAEVVFTSGATEANHMAVHGALARGDRRGILSSAMEHAGFHKMLRQLPNAPVDWIAARADGGLDLDHARGQMHEGLALVSVMAANNETGVLMPVAELAELAHAQGALLHVDATQWVGKLPFDFASFPADLVTVSAHKMGGPKGVGALLVRSGLNWPATIVGSQERGRRGGTENLPGLLGWAAACEALAAAPERSALPTRIRTLRDELESGLQAALPGTVVWGAAHERLPNTTLLRFGLLPAELVLQRMETLDILASSGAACASSGSEPSHVLTAMGVDREAALCAIRLSLGPTTLASEIRQVLDALPPLLAPLMAEADTPVTAP